MPARRKTGGVRSPMSDDNDKDNEAYRLKRQRNNDVNIKEGCSNTISIIFLEWIVEGTSITPF